MSVLPRGSGGTRSRPLRVAVLAALSAAAAWAAPTILAVEDAAADGVGLYEKFEASFVVESATATKPYWPYDADPPAGVAPGVGISADAIFVDPQGTEYRQPAFYGARYLEEIREGRDWFYPTGEFDWRVRFAPNQVGRWRYRIVVRDASGDTATPFVDFDVAPSEKKGFIKVAAADPRYFEFDDGSLFRAMGVQMPEFLTDPMSRGRAYFADAAGKGLNFGRIWISSVFGTSWNPYLGGRNQYRGYLPVSGLVPLHDDSADSTELTMRLDYEPEGDTGWFDACRLTWWDAPEAVRPGANYRITVVYRATDIAGPRNPSSPNYGLVVKLGGFNTNCHEPGVGAPATNYGGNADGWSTIEGVWSAGANNFLPRLHLALENVTRGTVHIRAISVREMRPDGSPGQEMLTVSSMQYDETVHQRRAAAFDRTIEAAEQAGLYLKIVLCEKDDKLWLKLNDDGSYAEAAGGDNGDGFYGLGRGVNRTRWIQQAWWRYAQARWGFSPSIHSWELTNEGDPNSRTHYEMTDEFARFMHQGVFGHVSAQDPGADDYDHPNDHMATTSFWAGLPVDSFWKNPAYPWPDYVDLHAYVSTSYAPADQRAAMESDAALYHLWHSGDAAARAIGKPVVRGEGGLNFGTRQTDPGPGLTDGIWLHNFLWATLDAGALHETYWWSEHIWSSSYDHRHEYGRLAAFLADLDLNRGGYVDWAGSATSLFLRVVGQKNPASGRVHLWIQNKRNAWKSRLGAVQPVSGTVAVPGLAPNAEFVVDRWETHRSAAPVVDRQTVRTDAAGVLTIQVEELTDDFAIKAAPLSSPGVMRLPPLRSRTGAKKRSEQDDSEP